jgi:hypothetical protein
MSGDATFYDVANVGVLSIPVKDAASVDMANVGVEGIPMVYVYPPQKGWGVFVKSLVPAGQIGAFSEARTYDTVDVTA